ncbi:MAG: sugar phosphate nucleotidyltransferase [Rikenellaceae bacterium]
MKIILLSGGSGKRLWPLSNDTRSKQFLKLLKAPNGEYESMVQRIARQVKESGIEADITIATSVTQYDSITNQLGGDVDIVTEPERRDTFPAIALSASYLLKEKRCDPSEVVVVMPSDSYVDGSYFATISKMAEVAAGDDVDMVLMGITPTEPSTKFGYIVPNQQATNGDLITVNRFTEKPNLATATQLIEQGAVWNGGVFAFKLSYIASIIDKYITAESFDEIRSRYSEFRKISFDYEVVEKATSIGLVPYSGQWSDLGTWNSLVTKIEDHCIGNVTTGCHCKNTHIINELETPIVCLGTTDLMVAASPDGILVSSKEASVELKSYADSIQARPMYEERRWGTYRVLGHEHFSDGHNALTKLLCLKAGCSISYQYHNLREEIWTFVDGEGLLVLDGEVIKVSRGSVFHIKAGQKHTVRATTDLQIIEVQTGSNLVEEDIIRLDWDWSCHL